MRFFQVALLGALLVGTIQGKMFLQDGKEYTYETMNSVTAGTMDHASHKSGLAFKTTTTIQVSGNTFNIRFSDSAHTEFVGAADANDWPYDSTRYQSRPGSQVISVEHDDSGLFKRLVVPSDADPWQRNVARAWAAMLQINKEEIAGGAKAFVSREQQLQGNCNMHYTVSSDAIRKQTVHGDDCEDRVFRAVDDFRGFKCFRKGDKPDFPGYPASTASTNFLLEKDGDGYKVNAMVSTSVFVAQYFEEEGSAQYIFTNSTSILKNVRSSPGDISASGDTITNLNYEFADGGYKWNEDRDLKAKEPFFGSGVYFTDDNTFIMNVIKKGLANQKTILEDLDKEENSIKNAHKSGINSLLPAFMALDYDSLMSLADELFADKSDSGVMKSNIFGELLGSAGTTAAALVVRDLVMQGKFDTDRDAAKALTAVPFHIRRPNKQLLKEFEKLIGNDYGRFTNMAIPLTFGHLVRITCERAGPLKSEAHTECVDDVGRHYVQKAYEKYQATSDHGEKTLLLNAMANMRFGGQSDLLMPIISGESETDEHLRANALYASGYDALLTKGNSFFLSIFAERSYPHQIRIFAVEMALFGKVTASDFTTIGAVLFKEKDYEIVNYVFAMIERWSNSINPCNEKVANLARYYLKFMKQFSNFETDWGFGVSKTYAREFRKEKYGYGGGYVFYVIGSHDSTTPLQIGAGMTSNILDGAYNNFMMAAHLRIEGLAKALIRKFKTTDPGTWKTEDLERILSGDMSIRERPDQPVRVAITIVLKGTVVVHRFYDESSVKEGGSLATFMEGFKDLGETYSINHQRAVNVGAFLYEQPTGLGLPMATLSSITFLGHLTATIKRGNVRGLLFRDVEYDMHTFTQAARITMFAAPGRKVSYGVVNDRIYHGHFPRKFVIGVNPIRKELKISIGRPEYNHPWRMFMHSQTEVVVRGHNLLGNYDKLKDSCPTCENRVVVSRGPDAVKDRVFIHRENEKIGAQIHGEYFNCEMDISKKNTLGHLFGAFMPYNKSPRTPWTSFMMGLRQIRTFFFYFPRNEQCGAMLKWSQSENNPVNEVEIVIRGQVEENGQRMFFRGRKWLIKALIKAKGEPADRSYRINLAYEFTPGYLENKLKVQINRAPLQQLNMDAYSICFMLENKYPDFSKEFLGYDEDSDMEVNGKAMIQYGTGNTCAEGQGEIRVKFQHSTTQEAREELKKKWYYKRCMELKDTPEWSGRSTLPLSEPCMMTIYDATSARKYTWEVEFVKLTDRLRGIISKVRTAVKAGLLPYYDIDPDELGGDDGALGPFLNVDVTLKDDETAADIRVETSQGEEEFTDVPLRLNWTKRLRNLKFTSTIKRLMDAKIISPCVVTTGTVRTNDNVTFSYPGASCWTLTSASCGPDPFYAVFQREGSGSTPLQVKAFFGGHEIDVDGTSVKINGEDIDLADGEEHEHSVDGTEIVKVFRWGSSINMYSFLRAWVVTDGHFLEVMPAPSVRGQHCGICGNFNRNKFDEFTGKDMQLVSNAQQFVDQWKWKC